jgi:hypothetical protein
MLSDEEKQAIRKKVMEQSGPWPFDLNMHAEEIERAVLANKWSQQVQDVPEGCTVADAKKLREANHALAIENFELKKKLDAADGEIKSLESAWHVEILNRKDQLIAEQEAENDRLKQIIRVAQSTTESIAAKASQQVPEFNGWYCAQCQCGVDPSDVTFHETHTVCGRYIADDEPPKAMPPQAAAIPESTGIDFDFISDCLLTYKSQLYFDGAEGLRNKIDEQIAAISAAPKPEGE